MKYARIEPSEDRERVLQALRSDAGKVLVAKLFAPSLAATERSLRVLSPTDVELPRMQGAAQLLLELNELAESIR